jgi:hypothetical protein
MYKSAQAIRNGTMPKAVFYQSIGPELTRYDIDDRQILLAHLPHLSRFAIFGRAASADACS